jgi:hypothetical protein
MILQKLLSLLNEIMLELITQCLNEYEVLVEERYAITSDEDQAKYFLQFNRTEGDIRYASHIYNLAVNGALKAVKAKVNENRHEYEHKPN